ncbi:phosphotransferase [Shewanella marisflavi]|nr:phosphotransferase [Shewanella marisflavi]
MNIDQFLCEEFDLVSVEKSAHLQTLWSGYGEIARYLMQTQQGPQSVIVKHISPPLSGKHPYHWNSKLSHQRKMTSYQVELNWYQQWAQRCLPELNLPRLLAAHQDDASQEILLVLSDLDAQGFTERRHHLDKIILFATIEWLAIFHGLFAHRMPKNSNTNEKYTKGLWPIGTYWHLATRPEELEAMENCALKEAAEVIDARLNGASYQTLVHGDAKVANFCFHPNLDEIGVIGVAALDFQYVGGGVGVKDLIYLLGSCLDEQQLSLQYQAAVTHYFSCLSRQLSRRLPAQEVAALTKEWQELLPLAWADFERFLAGWQPQHSKRHGFSESMTQKALHGL